VSRCLEKEEKEKNIWFFPSLVAYTNSLHYDVVVVVYLI
jgi:hypothetical protein